MSKKVMVTIGRSSGPITDVMVESTFDEEDIATVKDTLAMVNKASGNKERWWIVLDNGDEVVPLL